MSASACYHCGEAVPSRAPIRAEIAEVERGFCCDGCRAAAEWLHQGGLGDYYALRSSASARVAPAPDFSAWDSRGFARLYLHEHDGISQCDLSIGNLRCAACAWLIDRVLLRMPGVVSVSVDPATTHARLRFDAARTPLSRIAAQLAALGYDPKIVTDPADAAAARRLSLKRVAVAGIGAMQAMMFTEALYWGAGELDVATRDFFRMLALLITTPVVLYSGQPFFRGAWRELRLRQPGMDMLVALAVGLAYLASLMETVRGGPVVYFDAAVMFVFLLGAARHVESVARARANERLQLIASAQYPYAMRLDASDRSQPVALAELQVGERIRVAGGESIPVDGVLETEAARVDESLLSGETTAQPKQPGELVLAGSIALDAPLTLRVSAVGTATRLGLLRAQIGNGLHAAAASTAPARQLATGFALAMLALALATALYWGATAPERALPAVLAVLAAACPCAFALALPTSLAAAHAMLAGAGVIVTRPQALQRASGIDRMVIDKTGTLTEGRPRLVECVVLDRDYAREDVLAIAAALERDHRHPLAHAFREFDRGDAVSAVHVSAGCGIGGCVDGRHWRLGRSDWLGLQDAGDLVLAEGDRAVARFVVADRVRAEAATAVAGWQQQALVEILSGDSAEQVAAVAAPLALAAHARQTPQQKRAIIAALRAKGHRVMMIGDGLNDAESLAAADVGVAMGGGAALAHCHADVLLLRDDLRLVQLLLDTARRMRRIARQNVAWAIGYHLAIVPFAVSGLMPPWLAAAGMAASSLLVTLNALRLRRRPSGGARPALPTLAEAHA
ncbi:MAG: cadmium-translocating P-type ATPase [Xanthomonadales bacterium]|nr:cadmium-translocating P-type ATPase [Xanthomonadales bacterium]